MDWEDTWPWRLNRVIRMQARNCLHVLRLIILARGMKSGRREYLMAQFRRTHGRAETGELKLRTRLLVDQMAVLGLFDQHPAVLCIGCRNGNELDYIRAKGAKEVVGIDIISVRSDILVMDMHALEFANAIFDVVYACHSLEHAMDPVGVGQEMARVLKPGGHVVIEVPVNFQPGPVDRNDFRDHEGVKGCFPGMAIEELFAECAPAHSLRNAEGTSIVRVILRLSAC